MDFITNDVLSGELVPILLGHSKEAVETARRFFKRFGTVSHLFCDRIPLRMRLTTCIKFHTVPQSAEDALLLNALKDYANQFCNADLILYLLPCTVDDASFLWRNRAELERYFVIADRLEMDKVWYGDTAGKEV